MSLDFHPAAAPEIQCAYGYYNNKDPSISQDFLAALDRSFDLITQFPERYPTFDHGTRRLLLQKFPYHLIYLHDNDKILVLAVAHSRKKPGYWSER